MTNAKLFQTVATEMAVAIDLANSAKSETVSVVWVRLLLKSLRTATCAAQELERRAAGVQPPKQGD